MIYGYIRVSTDKQTLENQEFEIKKFTKKQHLKVNKWLKETISSTTQLQKRGLWKLLNRLQKGDILITSEISRLGRNLLQIMSILHHCMNVEAQVWTIKDNYRLGSDIHSKVLAFAFGLSAEIERNLISQRTKEALDRIKSEGKKLGRPVGCKNKKRKLDNQKNTIQKMLFEEHLPKTITAQKLGVCRLTLYRHLWDEEKEQLELPLRLPEIDNFISEG
jgi:DNA invertase Pin-like site-specific DNA recombinase